MWEREVAHEPPRRTYWLHMNLPLYSPTAPAFTGRFLGKEAKRQQFLI